MNMITYLQSVYSVMIGSSHQIDAEYSQPKGSDALWLGSKVRYVSCVGGR